MYKRYKIVEPLIKFRAKKDALKFEIFFLKKYYEKEDSLNLHEERYIVLILSRPNYLTSQNPLFFHSK